MKRTYLCPHCRALLNPGVAIVLRAQLGEQRGLFLLSPTPGNYDVTVPEPFALEKQAEVTFSCPVCGADLTSPRDRGHAEIFFASARSTGTVVFSRVYGQHETYFVTEREVKSYGEHARTDTVNFWGAGPDA